MILIDSSVWIDHIRSEIAHVEHLLDERQVLMHPMVIGELACGNLRDRDTLLAKFRQMPRPPELSHNDVLQFIEDNRVMGLGIGFVDAHILASTAKAEDCQLWTNDRRLRDVADRLNVAYDGEPNP